MRHGWIELDALPGEHSCDLSGHVELYGPRLALLANLAATQVLLDQRFVLAFRLHKVASTRALLDGWIFFALRHQLMDLAVHH